MKGGEAVRGRTRNAIWRLRNDKTKREGKKCRQLDLARYVGVPRSRISQIENGWFLPTRKELNKIAEYFGVIPEQLYSRVVIEAIDEMDTIE